jgi:hypothetical protein
VMFGPDDDFSRPSSSASASFRSIRCSAAA